jgi:hypothetical protein
LAPRKAVLPCPLVDLQRHTRRDAAEPHQEQWLALPNVRVSNIVFNMYSILKVFISFNFISVDRFDMRDPEKGLDAALRYVGDKEAFLDEIQKFVDDEPGTVRQKATLKKKMIKTCSCKLIFFCIYLENNIVFTLKTTSTKNITVYGTGHDQESAFTDVDFGANPHGLALAAGFDFMHAFLGGIGKNLIEFIIKFLKQWNLLTPINIALMKMNKKTSDKNLKLKTISKGIENLGIIDSTLVPGVLTQLSVALGNIPPTHKFISGRPATKTSKKGKNKKEERIQGLTKARLRQIQRSIFLYRSLCRHRNKDLNTVIEIKVRRIQNVLFIKFNMYLTYSKQIMLNSTCI